MGEYKNENWGKFWAAIVKKWGNVRIFFRLKF